MFNPFAHSLGVYIANLIAGLQALPGGLNAAALVTIQLAQAAVAAPTEQNANVAIPQITYIDPVIATNSYPATGFPGITAADLANTQGTTVAVGPVVFTPGSVPQVLGGVALNVAGVVNSLRRRAQASTATMAPLWLADP